MSLVETAEGLAHGVGHLMVLGTVAGLLVVLVYLSALPRPLPGIPYNKASSRRLFGDLKQIRSSTYRRQWIWSQPREHGAPLSQLFLFPFRRPTVVISDYRIAMDICARRTREFDRGTRNKECVGLTAPNFHFTMETRDARFRIHRELLRDLMAPWFIKEVAAPRIYNRVSLLVDLWGLKQSKAGTRSFSATRDLYLATLDMISSVAFGMEDSKAALKSEILCTQGFDVEPAEGVHEPVVFPCAPEDAEIEALLDIPDMVALAQSSPFPTMAQWLALLKPKHARAHWNRKSLLRRQTAKSLHRLSLMGEKAVPESALDELLWRESMAASKTGRNADFYSPAIRDEVLGYLLGGHDSTATLLAWWIKHMTRHQDVQNRLRRALCEAHGLAQAQGRWPSIGEILSASIPYLDAVLEESLRCASVVTLIVRTTTCDTQIQGYPIPKGTDVMIPLTGPSLTEPALRIPQTQCLEAEHVPGWGDDVGEYRPERWLKRQSDGSSERLVFDAKAGPNLAFSAGPRQCFGKKQACLQLRMTVTLLLWNFVFEPVDEALGGWEITERLVNLPKQCHVKLRRP
ncbi:hypothetical protein CDD81_6696 [Ophiocordyceps australis]|uniref:Cytochrome P450 monooxygenase n=1 Tax=Ophiocordyceps australis TaxID=1399860 RepID=A0A2C5Y779_9HYPO|nr:hypothetical protein CDD81_6696 [Ophiocordyceps australis]